MIVNLTSNNLCYSSNLGRFMSEQKKRCFSHIAKLIREKRVNHPKNYSQSELSQMLGYKNGQFISNVERALCNVPLKMLPKVSQILDISPADLKRAMLEDHQQTLENYLNYSEEATVTSYNTTGGSQSEEENSTPTSISQVPPTPLAAKPF